MSLNLSIKMGIDDFNQYSDILSSIVGDISVPEAKRNVVFWITKDGLRLAANAPLCGSFAGKVENAVIERRDGGVSENGNDMFSLKLRDITSVLDSYASLQKTYVDSLIFDINGNECILSVVEEPKDPEDEFADNYRKTSMFKVTLTNDLVKDKSLPERLISIDFDVNGAEYESDLMSFYLSALTCMSSKESAKASATDVIFGEKFKYAYAANKHIGAFTIIKNATDVVNIAFTRGSLAYLGKFTDMVSACDKKAYSRMEDITNDTGKVTCRRLYFAADNCAGWLEGIVPKPIDFEPHENKALTSGIIVDRQYLISILKRCDISNENPYYRVYCKDGTAQFTIRTTKLALEVPILKSYGECDYSWSQRCSDISAFILASMSDLEAPLSIEFAPKDDNHVFMKYSTAVIPGDDNSQLEAIWTTYLQSVNLSTADLRWD